MIDISSYIADSTFFFLITDGTLLRQPILRVKWAKLPYLPSYVVPAFQNDLEDLNSDLRILSGNDFSILYINLVRFSPVTSEFMRVVCLAAPL